MSVFSKIFGGPGIKTYREMDRSLTTDIHSHLIPGIDDGCKTMDDVLEILQELADQGIQKVITTPHVIYDLYPNGPEKIKQGEQNVREAINAQGLDITFRAAAEYYVDETFVERHIKGNAELLTLDDRHILIETNYVEKPDILEEVIFELKLKGYQVILAHPERYHYLLNNFSSFEHLRTTGILYQVNLMSFTGYYNQVVKKAAMHLMKKGLVDLVGSDIHRMEHARIIGQFKHSPDYRKLMEMPLLNNQL